MFQFALTPGHTVNNVLNIDKFPWYSRLYSIQGKNEYYWRSPYNKQFIETDIIVGFVFCGFLKGQYDCES
jgi:hypothetical protein